MNFQAMKSPVTLLLAFLMLFSTNLDAQIFRTDDADGITFIPKKSYVSGAMRTDLYVPLLQGKRVAFVGNQTSIIGNTHDVDSLRSCGVNICKIFTPEHGFRGAADAGAVVSNETDAKTGIPLFSLYGNNKKPSAEMLGGIDVIVFDLQDVGVRFYTYISTMTYVMEAAAENGIPVIVLDRPNPNGFYIDGPVLQDGNTSFVGLHRIPVVYAMTIGEYAKMVNGEGWLKNAVHCDLTVIPVDGYIRNAIYELPVNPSPNLPNWESVYLYPTLCFFEGTIISVGRGTTMPFQIYGHPSMRGDYTFTPESRPGASHPLLEGKRCRGANCTDFAHNYKMNANELHLSWIIDAYHQLDDKGFFTNYFRLLAGNTTLRQQIEKGLSEDEIRATWQDDINSFKLVRGKYLIYDDLH